MTFHINNQAYTVDIGEDNDNMLRDGLKKFLPLDKNLNTSDLLLAYLKKSEELVLLEYEILNELKKLPALE